MRMRDFGLASFFILVSGCAHGNLPVETGERAPLCASSSVRVFTDFPGAGQHSCTVISEREIVLATDHEHDRNDAINPSPWYAFSVIETGDMPVTLRIDYADYEHRYTPKSQSLNGEWVAISPEFTTLSEDEHQFSISLGDATEETVIAGQPILSSQAIFDRYQALADTYGADLHMLGQSREGRPLYALTYGLPTSDQLVIAMTRQHPPEFSGAQTFDYFAEDMLQAVAAADDLNFRLVMFPNANPDGIDNGHWRNNTGGWDLNRNWFEASEPEIAAIQDQINTEAEGKGIIAFMDFHSTWDTLVYTHPFEGDETDMRLPSELRDLMNASINPQPEWIVGHQIINGTSKNWAKLEHQTGGITIELADDAPDQVRRQIAASSVEAVFNIADQTSSSP
ncbi:M14 family zinc carboxypeptidase [Ponticaulis sp.]|uniref:M14 family zinc carboxypeptidase n=1 Tax=Ponticaulis sp. TaxID=2020902 RepID=UPI0025DA76AC|nr:M14 family zinc carboxypeptidase [Ponticaulis sp.]